MPTQAKFNLGSENKFRLLTKPYIRELVEEHRLIVDDTFSPTCLEETSYDIRIGRKAILGGKGQEFDLEDEPLIIEAGSYAGVISFEKFALPTNIFGRIGSKRKFSYDGVILLTGSLIDPGYEGFLLFGLYNASTKKVVLPTKTKLCTVTFTQIEQSVEPVSADPSLLSGDFPSDFINKMANTEVLPWARISDEVKQIQRITQDILDLKKQYSDVLQPIKDLTRNVEAVNRDVATLTEQVAAVTTQMGRLETVTNQNATQITDLVASVKLANTSIGTLTRRSEEQEVEVRSLGKEQSKTSTMVTVLWVVLALFVGALVTLLITRALAADSTKPPMTAPSQNAPASPSPS
jgi:deoxycytidine triphosphate deaminase